MNVILFKIHIKFNQLPVLSDSFRLRKTRLQYRTDAEFEKKFQKKRDVYFLSEYL